ncbi:MAG TPA: Uma2 family endonuclease [Candidatus Xenobia bacterium]
MGALVEVLSPSNKPRQIQRKIAQYLAAGARLVWVVDPKKRRVLVHHPAGRVDIVTENQDLDGLEVVPRFLCTVRDIL